MTGHRPSGRRSHQVTGLAAAGLLIAFAVVGCDSAAATPTPATTPVVTAAATLTAVPTPAPTATPTATPTPTPTPAPAAFTPIASMNAARSGEAATLLTNGRVLITGGAGPAALASAELYDPHSRTFLGTYSMKSARSGHTATLLANGHVLIVGGSDLKGNYQMAAETYDPVTSTFTQNVPGYTARSGHTATLLADGRVLVVGGKNVAGTLGSAFLYDPTANAITVVQGSTPGPAGPNAMKTARYGHTATLLADGRVLIVGGTAGPRLSSRPSCTTRRPGSSRRPGR